MRGRRVVRGLAVATAVGLLVTGCAGFRIERNGKEAGESLCDLRDADNADEAQEALEDVNKEIEDAARIVGRPLDEDVDDIQENISDLVEHVAEGQSNLVEQDIAVIRRNIQAVVSNATGATERFYQGVDQGLGDCSD